MEGLRFGAAGDRRGSLRRRVVILAALPSCLLGLTYFLFVEYVRASGTMQTTFVLRVGGAVLVLLALVLGLASGYLLSERVTRPIRLLVRLAESGDIGAGRAAFLHHREWEIWELYRRVHSLVQQNKAGGRALEELESLRSGLGTLRQELNRRGQHGVLPAMLLPADGVWSEIGQSLEANRRRTLAFVHELGERLRALREDLESLGQVRGFSRADANDRNPASTPSESAPRGAASLARLRRTGTVLALETERWAPRGGRRLGEWIERFDRDMRALETDLSALATVGPPADEIASFEVVWGRTLDGIESLERLIREVEAR
ncbi:MAG: hypothetical protein U0527_05220 [Candidatus Eisenbacteria bacterium]